MTDEPKELVEIPIGEAIKTDNLIESDDVLAMFEKRQELLRRVTVASIKATNPQDWSDQAGKPYLEASGCEKIARMLSISITDVGSECEEYTDKLGSYYIYTFKGKASLNHGKESVVAIGTCSSRDKFFGKAKGEYKQTEAVDRTNIKKKAYTNMFGNCVRKLLGLNKLTWDELKASGIEKGKTSKVDYKKKDYPGNRTKTPEKSKKSPYWTSEHQGKKYLFARQGNHFPAGFLEGVGMRESRTPQIWVMHHEDAKEIALKKRCDFVDNGGE